MTAIRSDEPKAKAGYRKILVATDFSPSSDAALEQSVWLARQTGAKIVLAHTLPDLRQLVTTLPAEARRDFFYGDGDLFDKEVRRDSDAKLQQAIGQLLAPELDITFETLLGTPYLELTHAVQQEGYDMVMAGTRGHSQWEHFFVGSTARRLVRNCPSSVWIVKGEHRAAPKVVLATTDFSDSSLKAVREGLRIAQWAGSEFHLMHVIEELDEELIKRSPHGSPMRKDVNDYARLRLESLVRLLETDANQVQLHLSLGTAWRVIARTALHLGADLVVIGTLGRTGVSRLLLGNTAEKVLETCDSSLLTVKPDGFISPVDSTFRVLHPE
jgi:universal stress protein E